ncbi:MFS general substrate transporter [Panaeolus papilionaceus]|nr:MFS general substrate transporter [Panaeolus papilionaceus]
MSTQITTIDLLRTSIEPSLRSIPRSHQSKGSRNENGFGYPPTQALGSNAAITNDVAGKSSEILPVLTSKQKILARVQFAALCWTLFVAGWNDGTTGPLLSRIQEVYGVNFAIVSLIFVFACVGFVSGAVSNMWLTEKLGFGKTLVLGSCFQIVAYSIQCAAPPFPAFVFAYVINGAGIALQDAQANGFVAVLKENPEAKMGVLHAAYGLGAFAAPLVATQFAQLPRWSFHFLVSLGVSVLNTIVLVMVFRFQGQDECLTEAGEVVPERTSASEEATFKQVLRTRAVHFLAFFVFVYVGVEVTIGGWIVTFIIQERQGGPSSGYISSGFFGGLTIGRVLLLWANKKVGEKRVVFLYALLSIGLEFVVWFVPSLIGNAVAVSIVGVLLGPMYAIAINHASRILPRWILTGSIGWIAGFGQAGSAVLPFMTGAIAEKHGLHSLQPLLVSMMGFMMVLWFLVPSQPRRVD